LTPGDETALIGDPIPSRQIPLLAWIGDER